MTEPTPRWPFDRDEEGHRKNGAQDRERARRDNIAVQKHIRFDRFLTGGRAHVRKHGLS